MRLASVNGSGCRLFFRVKVRKSLQAPQFGSFSRTFFLQLEEFVPRLKETKLGHRHFYEVHSVFAIPSSILIGCCAGLTQRQRLSRLHGP